MNKMDAHWKTFQVSKQWKSGNLFKRDIGIGSSWKQYVLYIRENNFPHLHSIWYDFHEDKIWISHMTIKEHVQCSDSMWFECYQLSLWGDVSH